MIERIGTCRTTVAIVDAAGMFAPDFVVFGEPGD
jgi:hypothetical protein